MKKLSVNIRFVINPFAIHIGSFGLSLFLCSLGWSGLYPKFSMEVLLFLFGTFFLSGIMIFSDKGRSVTSECLPNKLPTGSALITLAVTFVFMISYVYSSGVPLLRIMSGDFGYDIYKFGLPGLHVFLLTFSSFYAVCCFQAFVKNLGRINLVHFLLVYVHLILIVSRSAALFVIASCAFIYLWHQRVVLVRRFILLALVAILILFAFGEIGNRRITFQIEQETGVAEESIEDVMLGLADATDSFKKTGLSVTFLWAYLYISSPIANFQYAVNHVEHVGVVKAPLILTDALLPDSLAKPIRSAFDLPALEQTEYISESLFVGTTFVAAYYAAGWIGVILFALLYFCSFMFILKSTHNTRYAEIARSLTCTMALFGVFDNMVAYSAMSLQLVYPILGVVLDEMDKMRGNEKVQAR